jgi:hypothetical protein
LLVAWWWWVQLSLLPHHQAAKAVAVQQPLQLTNLSYFDHPHSLSGDFIFVEGLFSSIRLYLTPFAQRYSLHFAAPLSNTSVYCAFTMNPLGKKSVLSCLALNSKLFSVVISALLISACAGDTSNTVYDTFKLGISNRNNVINATPLNPNYRYLKVEANGQPALLVLGYVDERDKASHDVWYSSFKETLEIRGGRLAATAGLEVNWTDVRIADAPPLLEVLTAQEASRSKRPTRMRYTRIRTVMPGYHVNIRETVVIELLREAPSSIPKELKAASYTQDIRWVQEVIQVLQEVTRVLLAL